MVETEDKAWMPLGAAMHPGMNAKGAAIAEGPCRPLLLEAKARIPSGFPPSSCPKILRTTTQRGRKAPASAAQKLVCGNGTGHTKSRFRRKSGVRDTMTVTEVAKGRPASRKFLWLATGIILVAGI